jgi:hypothetical protein
MFMKIRILLVIALLCPVLIVHAQQKNNDQHEIYIDAKGVIRLQQNGQEAGFFGVNYTLPFAYGYRSHKTRAINIEKAIDMDVYHLAHLGINAFRVHVWDTEISDSLGNLKNNEHLRLFDYLVSKLEERNIRIIITPIAYWGNGYPDKDEKTGSFSEKYGKEGAVVKEEAFKAQEQYLKQFFKHVNPYTKKTYGEDRFVIATEINNEPHHSGPKSLTTSYVNRMIAAVKSTGWTKPVFYNISESPLYADAVAKSDANGFSFQWYPTGLVAGRELLGNLLPNVDKYVIPFDTIPQFKNKARMVYEFDAADVLKSYMYPAMARSFKTAGFQWATQFAYDPVGTAYANTEYQTHYLNLVYTPSKAISLLIAGHVFREVPLYKSYGSFPADTAFGPFTVSYKRNLSQMNTEKRFYYSNDTEAKPVNAAALEHIAGVGSSQIVSYNGSGAYFMDKMANGSWRLEVFPNVISMKDPFGKGALDNTVTMASPGRNQMKLNLPDLGGDFQLIEVGKNEVSDDRAAGYSLAKSDRQAVNGSFAVIPGTYILLKKGNANTFTAKTKVGELGLFESGYNLPFERKNVEVTIAPPPLAGISKDTIVYAGKLVGEKAGKKVQTGLSLYQPAEDKDQVVIYSPEWKSDPYEYITDASGTEWLKLQHKPVQDTVLGGLEIFVKDKIYPMVSGKRLSAATVSADHYKNLVITAVGSAEMPVKVIFITADAVAYSTTVVIGKEQKEISIPLNSLQKDVAVLLPRPYPGFQAMTFSAPHTNTFQINQVEKIQLLLKGDAKKEFSIEIGNIRLDNK